MPKRGEPAKAFILMNSSRTVGLETKTQMTKRSNPFLIQQRACLLRNIANSSIMSFSRNFKEQENAHCSSLEILMWLPGICAQHSDFFRLSPPPHPPVKSLGAHRFRTLATRE